jgi:crotonobetainyl-CoA:carnitine CoA-transferase CaiB-like acyl-CoA transferase
VTGEVPESDGNFHPEVCPHGAYPCQMTDWISIAAATETEWQALCTVLGEDDLAADPRFASLALRLENRHALDTVIAELTVHQDAGDLAESLRQAGVPAAKSMSSIDLCSDDFLWGREAYRMVSDHKNGTRPIIGPSWRISPDGPRVERGAPLLGEHNDYVYREILGLPQERLDDLIARKVID